MRFKPEYLTIVFILWELIGLLTSNILMIVFGLLILVVMFTWIKEQKDKENSLTNQLAIKIFNKYNITKYHIGTDNLSCVGINEKESKVVFLTKHNIHEEFKPKSIQFNEIFKIKLIEDDLTITSTDRASQLGGALVGGLIGGGIGAIIGGSGGTQYNEKKVRKIELQFVIDNLNNPIEKVSFMNEDLHIDKYDKRYKTQFELANNWYKMFSIILKRNEKEYRI